MPSAMNKFENYPTDPKKLQECIEDNMEQLIRKLKDDEEFCNKDIDSTIEYAKMMEKKLMDKFREMEKKLEQLRKENERRSKENKEIFEKHIDEIHGLLNAKKYYEAWQKFQDCNKRFEQRYTVIKHIPKLHLNDSDIERCFPLESSCISNHSPVPAAIQPPVVPTSITTNNQMEKSIDDTPMTFKQKQRSKKMIETIDMDKGSEDIDTETTKDNIDYSNFGNRSRQRESQQNSSTINGTATNLRTGTIASQPIYTISTRLPSISNKSNYSTHTIQNQANLSNHQDSISYKRYSPFTQLRFNTIAHYQHDRHRSLLMACNYKTIIFYKSSPNRLDQWQLGTIERATQYERILPWHDGLIISMGCIDSDLIYMFTEREFSLYSISQQRKRHTRILRQGNNDDYEYVHSSVNYPHRGIGTVYNKHWYHIYFNHSSNWTLSKNNVDQLAHLSDIDLTHFYPDVLRFIHLCAYEKHIYFLVQNTDHSYAVISYPLKDPFSPILLPNAQEPLTICVGYSKSLREHLLFINDPSANILHIIINETYLQSYPLTAYAICYLEEKNELLLATDQSIQSINLNKIN